MSTCTRHRWDLKSSKNFNPKNKPYFKENSNYSSVLSLGKIGTNRATVQSWQTSIPGSWIVWRTICQRWSRVSDWNKRQRQWYWCKSCSWWSRSRRYLPRSWTTIEVIGRRDHSWKWRMKDSRSTSLRDSERSQRCAPSGTKCRSSCRNGPQT